MLKNGSPRSSLIMDSNSWGAPTSGASGGYTPPGIGLSSSPTMGPGLSGLGGIAPLSIPSPSPDSYGLSAQDTINNIYAPPSTMDTSAGATQIPGINTPSVPSPSVAAMNTRIGLGRIGSIDQAQPMRGQRLMA